MAICKLIESPENTKNPKGKIGEPTLKCPSPQTFTVTAGHNSINDPGAKGNGYGEAVLATELRNLVVIGLKSLGHTVKKDGEGEDNWTLKEAIKLIPGSDVAIEIHFNAAASLVAGGVETISLNNIKDKTLSQQFSKAIADVIGSKVRGDHGWINQEQSARGKLGYISAGGLILEICFISNKTEIESYVSNKQKVADAIVKVLNDWAIKEGKKTSA